MDMPFAFDDKLLFNLPEGYEGIWESDESEENDDDIGPVEWKEPVCKIVLSDYERGKREYQFSCSVNHIERDVSDYPDDVNESNFLEYEAEREQNTYIEVCSQPKILVEYSGKIAEIFGIKMCFQFLQAYIAEEGYAFYSVMTSIDNTSPETEKRTYEQFCDVLKSMEYNYDSTLLSWLTTDELYEKLGGKCVYKEQITRANDMTRNVQTKINVRPREEQYPHLKELQGMRSVLQGMTEGTGASFTINATGMEYQFIPLEALKDENDEDWDADESDEEEENDEQREVLERIICADTPDDDLYQKAEEIRPMFRVSPDDFDPNSDQECEIEKGYIHSVRIFHALRSFAWTLCCYAELKGCQPEEMTDMADVEAVVKLILSRNFLNYGDNYCRGLCAGSDLHVYYTLVKYNGDEKIVVVPAGIRKIGFEAFGKNEPGQSKLERVVLPEGLEEIELFAFSCCDQLQFVNLPDSLIKIGENAFWNCKKLTEIRIPESVEYIGESVFESCEALLDIYTPDYIEKVEPFAFDTGNIATKLHARPGSIMDMVYQPNQELKKKLAEQQTEPAKRRRAAQTNEAQAAPEAPKKKEGCYIATAVYDSYDAPEVRTLRRFRDETLKKSAAGRMFIRVYYRFSPPIAQRLKNATKVNRLVRRMLDGFVEKLNEKKS